MSTLPDPRQQEPQKIDWSRLIPGGAPAFPSGQKRPAQSVKPEEWRGSEVSAIRAEARTNWSDNSLVLLVARPWQSPTAGRWLPSATADLVLVGMNWLLIWGLLLCFPQVRIFQNALTPVSLVGIAMLHATLITLMGYNEGLYAGCGDVQEVAGMLAKSVLWATTVLAFAFGLQASWATRGVICGAELLDFGALLTWRSRNAKRHRGIALRVPARNVLIVGAGAVGQRVAAHIEGHPEAGRCLYGFLDNERPLGDKVIGRMNDLARLARTGFVDEVILAAPHDRDMALSVLHEARRLRLDVEIVPELFGCEPVGTEVERVGDLPVICLHAERLPAGAETDCGRGRSRLCFGRHGSSYGGDRGADQAGFAGIRALWSAASGTEEQALSLLQVSHHGEPCG